MRSASPGVGPTRRLVEPPLPVHFDIRVVSGAAAGLAHAVEAGLSATMLLGSSPVCDLRLPDPAVSRRHASLEFAGAQLCVKDLGSTNGTFVNDTRVLVAIVAPGDRLRLGDTVLEARARYSKEPFVLADAGFGRMIGVSAKMRTVFALASKLAGAAVPIVIEGETGTGKELLAECIHEAGPRAAGPFVVLDCRGTPKALLGEVLFGGGGAEARRPGILERASGGTLLLDEPGDLDLESQGTLLSLLDEGRATRAAGDVRLVTASRRDLDRLVEEGRFREDLYFRLAGARLELPPLRRRPEDVAPLAKHFFELHGGRGALPEDFLTRFDGYDWPGNARELDNAVGRYLALGEHIGLAVGRSVRRAAPAVASSGASTSGSSPVGGAAARAPHAPSELDVILEQDLAFPEARQRMLEVFERAFVERALKIHGGNIGRAAAASGIARRYFQMIRARHRDEGP